MKNRKILISSLGIVLALVLGIAVAYAALSATLNARFNSVTVSKGTWDVGISTNWSGTEGSSTGDNSNASCGWITYSKNSATVESITLAKPGDGCEYPIYLVNDGDIDAKLSTITANEPSGVTCSKRSINETTPVGSYEVTTYGYEMVCGNLTYKITSTSDMIRGNGSSTAYLNVSYTGTDLSPTPIVHTNPGFTFVFGQA